MTATKNSIYSVGLLSTLGFFGGASADVVVGDTGISCAADPACINRLHPEIPPVAEADPGERIVFNGRDAFDLTLDPDKHPDGTAPPLEGFGIVHAKGLHGRVSSGDGFSVPRM